MPERPHKLAVISFRKLDSGAHPANPVMHCIILSFNFLFNMLGFVFTVLVYVYQIVS